MEKENIMGESKAPDPMVVEPRRWYVFRDHCSSRPSGMGRAAHSAAKRDTQRSLSTKKKCATHGSTRESQLHTAQTGTLSFIPSFLHSFLPSFPQ